MITRWLAASFHLLALGIGLGGVWCRGRALGGPLDQAGLRRVFQADAAWGIAAMLWVGTGLWRLLAGLEKSTGYYLQNHVFMAKMALFLLVVVLEVWPMMTLIRWRRRVAAGQQPDVHTAPALARISYLQAGLVVLIVFAATAMARGYGM
jgi:putative membrane protein